MTIPAAWLCPATVCASCGRTHRLGLREVLLADDAPEQLPRLVTALSPQAPIVLLADRRTYDVAGNQVETILRRAGLAVRFHLVADPAPGVFPNCDDRTHARLMETVPPCGLLVAVGSGVICDLAKWLAMERGIPYLAVATAASMNGYASDNIAPSIQGVKCLINGRGPAVIVSTPTWLLQAPYEMTMAGLGDVIAKPVSASDWRLNHLLFGEAYCDFLVNLYREAEPKYQQQPEALKEGRPEAYEGLFDALVLSGMAMSMAGTSAPASGGEHLISHTLDMMSVLAGRPHDLHGRQVGVSTILCAAIYDELMHLEKPEFKVPKEADPEHFRRFWGGLAPAMEPFRHKKQAITARAVEIFRQSPERWDQIRETLRPGLRSPKAIRDCLHRAGAAACIADLGVSREQYLQALEHAHEIRERFTVLDLARITGLLPARAGELADGWIR